MLGPSGKSRKGKAQQGFHCSFLLPVPRLTFWRFLPLTCSYTTEESNSHRSVNLILVLLLPLAPLPLTLEVKGRVGNSSSPGLRSPHRGLRNRQPARVCWRSHSPEPKSLFQQIFFEHLQGALEIKWQTEQTRFFPHRAHSLKGKQEKNKRTENR